MNFSEMKGVFKTSIATVKSIENPYENYYVIELNTEPGITWKPGEHGIFTLPDKKVEGSKFRSFSIASIPSEGKLLLGTKTGNNVSSYKKALFSMKPGEKVKLRGPFGDFLIQDEVSPMVFFASGVGITRFRGLLKELEHNTNRPIEIVYSSNQYYLFNDEIQNIVDNNRQMKLYKTVSVEETQAKMDELAQKYNNKAYYYISGAPGVIKSVKKKLKEAGVKGNRMISDNFFGY